MWGKGFITILKRGMDPSISALYRGSWSLNTLSFRLPVDFFAVCLFSSYNPLNLSAGEFRVLGIATGVVVLASQYK